MVCNDFERACAPKGLRRKPGKLQLRNNLLFSRVRGNSQTLKVQASVAFFRSVLCRGRTGARHRVGLAWAKLWAIKRQVTTRALSPPARLQLFRPQILFAMTCGSTAWHMREEVLCIGKRALTCLPKIGLAPFSPTWRAMAGRGISSHVGMPKASRRSHGATVPL